VTFSLAGYTAEPWLEALTRALVASDDLVRQARTELDSAEAVFVVRAQVRPP
jgi:hypothetical protein